MLSTYFYSCIFIFKYVCTMCVGLYIYIHISTHTHTNICTHTCKTNTSFSTSARNFWSKVSFILLKLIYMESTYPSFWIKVLITTCPSQDFHIILCPIRPKAAKYKVTTSNLLGNETNYRLGIVWSPVPQMFLSTYMWDQALT